MHLLHLCSFTQAHRPQSLLRGLAEKIEIEPDNGRRLADGKRIEAHGHPAPLPYLRIVINCDCMPCSVTSVLYRNAMEQRILPMSGIHNFRDYGGYRARDGARVKTALLFRSGQHAAATTDDLAQVARLGLRTVVDLRGDSERRLYPCLRQDGFAATVLYAGGETSGGGAAPHLAVAREAMSADDAKAALTATYAGMPFRPVLVGTLRLFFEALASTDGASLIHCLAGKDRTGLAVALLHLLVGVHPDDVMTDYLLTNSAGDSAARIAAGAPVIRASYGDAISDEAIAMLMSVQPEFLETALAAINAAHGDVSGYAAAMLHVSPARLQEIERRLLS